MDLSDFKSVTIPQRDDPRHEKLAKRWESCRPMEFGLYVNRHGDPKSHEGYDRVGENRRACRMAPSSIHPHLRLALHRSVTC
ncbi:hypothetical protein BGW80DRAFT_1366596 [Lactifluus volemus]|nr:hypothetical protein BGW80DRAFT_1366596 [Lactifluus volemus]